MEKSLVKWAPGWWFETLSRPLWRHCNDDSSVFGIVDELYWRSEVWSQELYIGLHIVEFFVGC